jgi:hypothetical protein
MGDDDAAPAATAADEHIPPASNIACLMSPISEGADAEPELDSSFTPSSPLPSVSQMVDDVLMTLHDDGFGPALLEPHTSGVEDEGDSDENDMMGQSPSDEVDDNSVDHTMVDAILDFLTTDLGDFSSGPNPLTSASDAVLMYDIPNTMTPGAMLAGLSVQDPVVPIPSTLPVSVAVPILPALNSLEGAAVPHQQWPHQAAQQQFVQGLDAPPNEIAGEDWAAAIPLPPFGTHASLAPENMGLINFLGAWARSARAVQSFQRGMAGAPSLSWVRSQADELQRSRIEYSDLKGEQCDFQGLDWTEIGVSRENALRHRRMTYRNYVNRPGSDSLHGSCQRVSLSHTYLRA